LPSDVAVNNSSNPLEQQLAQALRENEELKKALREIEASVGEVQAAIKEMEHMVYAVSHDFRQPLRSMSGYAQLLQRQYALDDDAREMTAFIVNSANEMKTLIEAVLNYSRIKSSPDRTTVNLGAIVACAAANLQAEIRESGAELTCGNLPELTINESQFVQLLQQLFANALKFRSTDPPKIEVTAEENADAHLISVRDNGMGIESKYHETVFAPFKRLHSKEVPGTGLGLAICRKILRAHRGRIWVESDGQHGSTFRFTVPF
jgi:light-regulated signal transduction histidine kinase (bacteriophytochrome)